MNPAPNPEPRISNPESRIPNPSAVSCFIFWTANASAVARVIVRVTGRQSPDKSDVWSHMGIGFYLSDGAQEYYEALFGQNVRGPLPLLKLKEWRLQHKGNAARMELTPLPPAVCEQKRTIVKSWVGTVGYRPWQLVCMWGLERLRIKIRPSTGVVCSELVTRILAPEIVLTDPQHPTPDSVNPNSAWRAWQAFQRRQSLSRAVAGVFSTPGASR